MAEPKSIFDYAAVVGLTKNFGGVETTRTLVELCHVDSNSFVLDVGTGVGQTACLLVKEIGCRVVGVDISEAMIQKARERAQKLGLREGLEFRVADAQSLPFEDNTFDAVITESVTVFPEDKLAAVSEYTRVVKPGGYVGLSEATYLKTPPPPEIAAYFTRELSSNAVLLSEAEWTSLLKSAGLQDLVVHISPIDVRGETGALVRRYGCGGMIGVFAAMFRLYLTRPDYRAFVKQATATESVPDNLMEYSGYGMYVGRKPA